MNTTIKAAMAIAAAAVAANANCKATPSVNTSLWFDGTDQQVNTGGDDMYVYGECEETTMGYWYDRDDRKNDNGSSFVAYPFDTTGYYGSLIAPEIETFNYVAIEYNLKEPVNQTAQYKYNFVDLAFNLVDGHFTPMDISATDGLCATYTSDMALTLEVVTEKTMLSTGQDPSCYIVLPRATTPTTVSKAIEDFAQPTWTSTENQLESCADAFASATSIRFHLDGGATVAYGKLRIFEVGPAGTCTGKGAYSFDEPASFLYKSDGNGHAALAGSSSSSSSSGSESVSVSGSVNTGLWFNGTNEQVNTGGDCMYEWGVCEETTMGYWYDFDDRRDDNGGSYVLYPYDTTGFYGSSIGPEIETLNYVTVDYRLVDPTTTGQTAQYPYNFVGLGFNLVNGKRDPMDITAAGGLCVTYTSDITVALNVETEKSSLYSYGTGPNCSIYLAKATKPTTVSKAIADFKQPTWVATENKLESCAEAFASAKSVYFYLDGGAAESQGRFRIFEVGPAGTCTGKGTISAEEPTSFLYKSDGNGHAALAGSSSSSSSEETEGSSSSMRYAHCRATPSVNTSLWFDGSDQQVNTGGDDMYVYGVCETSTMGYWYDFDDRKFDNGGSYVYYPFDTTGYYGSLIAPEIETFNYVAIEYQLVDPSTTKQTAEYAYNFVGLGFNLVDSYETPMDITATDGLCATYTSNNAVTLQVVTESTEADGVYSGPHCSVTLLRANTPTTVSKAIEDFAQPTWTSTENQLESCADAFANATAVRFYLDGGASNAQGKLRIFEVGPAGTCKGIGSISADEPNNFVYKSDGNGHAAFDPANPIVCCTDMNHSDSVGISPVMEFSSVKATYANHVLSISGLRDAANYDIVSLLGQVVKSGVATSSVNLSSLQAGTYMVRIHGKSVNMSQMILVK